MTCEARDDDTASHWVSTRLRKPSKQGVLLLVVLLGIDIVKRSESAKVVVQDERLWQAGGREAPCMLRRRRFHDGRKGGECQSGCFAVGGPKPAAQCERSDDDLIAANISQRAAYEVDHTLSVQVQRDSPQAIHLSLLQLLRHHDICGQRVSRGDGRSVVSSLPD